MKNIYKSRRIAIVYDWIDKWGGVERVLLYLHNIFPHATFYTSFYEKKTATWADELRVTSSFMQRIPAYLRSKRALMIPLYPLAFESFDFSGYDLVLSVTSSFAKGITTKPGTKHICYLLTPMRYAWSHCEEYFSAFPKPIARALSGALQAFDKSISKRPDAYISISKAVAERCRNYYGVESSVVYPPFDFPYWLQQEREMYKPKKVALHKGYYLWVGRMEKYKHAKLVVEAARMLPQRQFVFVGEGSQSSFLRKIAPKNCQFLGKKTDRELAYLYSHARALLMPQNEDFGYVSLEAQFFECPVIAYGKGGALETVVDGKTGIFFHSQTIGDLIASLERFDQISYNLIHHGERVGRSHVKRFDAGRFQKEFFYQLEHIYE